MSSSSAELKMALAKRVLSRVGLIVATIMLVHTIIHNYIPRELHAYLFFGIKNMFTKFSKQLTMVIDKFDGLVNNKIYEAATIYLANKLSPHIRRLKISKTEKEKISTSPWNVMRRFGFADKQSLTTSTTPKTWIPLEICNKKKKDLVLNSYLSYIMEEAILQKHKNKMIKIHTVGHEEMYNLHDMWKPLNFDHPATFETIPMESDKKHMILKDLEIFMTRKKYYRKVGKAWKRGYLLFGPLRTGNLV
ncbi:hypothetical protein H5410_014075 [Solanum commersonii]|uniref:AAA-type ATPase N-terminal domain-containing protein n=1 Tax=Solanum commersonii TaxID=4109 RepID=A0A9J5ZQ68_SOLCO|nr:hypothetical protein H5410_014075 [Solanum commersonii]